MSESMPEEIPAESAFFPPQQPMTVDDLIASARPPERSCTVFLRPDLVAEHERLEAELADAEGKRVSGDARLSGDPLQQLAQRLRDVEQEIAASAVTFRFRSLAREDDREIAKAAPPSPDDPSEKDAAWLGREYIARAMVEARTADGTVLPPFTRPQVDAFADRIGTGQFFRLAAAANQATHGRLISVPLSLRASHILGQEDRS